MDVWIWLGILIFLLALEAATVGLVCIWFAAGAAAALLAGIVGIGIWGQFVIFSAVSILLLVFTRPAAARWLVPFQIKTNYESAIGQTVKITERVDNTDGIGKAVLNGLEWSARTKDAAVRLKEGDLAKVDAVEGVKLILVPLRDEQAVWRKEQSG